MFLIVFKSIVDCLTDVRQSLAAPRLVGKQDGGGQNTLADLLQTTHTAQVEQIKSVLCNLQVGIYFTQSPMLFDASANLK